MKFLILSVCFSLFIINKINGESCINGQKCGTGYNTWCCASSTTCGEFGACKILDETVKSEYCPGQTACFSIPYYWCCSSDQHCGGFRQCSGGSLETFRYLGIGFGILLGLCGLCCGICRYQQRQNLNRPVVVAGGNQRMRAQPSAFRNMGAPTRSNPVQQTMTVLNPGALVALKEEAPPAYDSVTVPETKQEQSEA